MMEVKYNENWHIALKIQYDRLIEYNYTKHAEILLDFRKHFLNYVHLNSNNFKVDFKVKMLQAYSMFVHTTYANAKPMEEVEQQTYLAYVINFLEVILSHV